MNCFAEDAGPTVFSGVKEGGEIGLGDGEMMGDGDGDGLLSTPGSYRITISKLQRERTYFFPSCTTAFPLSVNVFLPGFSDDAYIL